MGSGPPTYGFDYGSGTEATSEAPYSFSVTFVQQVTNSNYAADWAKINHRDSPRETYKHLDPEVKPGSKLARMDNRLKSRYGVPANAWEEVVPNDGLCVLKGEYCVS